MSDSSEMVRTDRPMACMACGARTIYAREGTNHPTIPCCLALDMCERRQDAMGKSSMLAAAQAFYFELRLIPTAIRKAAERADLMIRARAEMRSKGQTTAPAEAVLVNMKSFHVGGSSWHYLCDTVGARLIHEIDQREPQASIADQLEALPDAPGETETTLLVHLDDGTSVRLTEFDPDDLPAIGSPFVAQTPGFVREVYSWELQSRHVSEWTSIEIFERDQ